MKKYSNYIDMLLDTRYIDKPKYKDAYIYPNTGNINVDYRIFQRTINLLSYLNDTSIERYFSVLNMVKEEAILPEIFNAISKNLPEIYNMEYSETDNFYITGNLGSLVEGYNLVISKKHILSMSASTDKEEYICLINILRHMYKDIYGIEPIIFEHGSNNIELSKDNSIDHAHTHIINHKYVDEDKIIKELELKEVDSIKELLEYGKNINYISYISNNGKYYIGEVKKANSQIMRKYIAKDINKEDTWDWRKYPYLENSFETNKKILLYKKGII